MSAKFFLVLMGLATAILIMNLFEWEGTMVFVAIYWGLLAVKYYIDWRRRR